MRRIHEAWVLIKFVVFVFRANPDDLKPRCVGRVRHRARDSGE